MSLSLYRAVNKKSPGKRHMVEPRGFFSRDEATLYEGVSVGPSVGPSVGWSVTSSFFGLLGATNAVYTA